MILEFAATSAYGNNIAILYVKLEAGEVINKGDTVVIPLLDGTEVQRKVVLLNPKLVGDFAEISEYASGQLACGECSKSKTETLQIRGECRGEIVVLDVSSSNIKTAENSVKRENNRITQICLTPFEEILGGSLSIHDFVQEGYQVPEKVIRYLKTTKPFMISPGIYDHPFKPGHTLLGPYWYTDGKYYWDRDTWKYVVKYGLTLPEEFIEYVMSEEGTAFLKEFEKENSSWTEEIKKMKTSPDMLCLLPDDAGDESLDDF